MSVSFDSAEAIVAKLYSLADPQAARVQEAKYGIPADGVLGVPMYELKAIAGDTGSDHDLADQLWRTGIYEARTLAAFVDDPSAVDREQMDRWCRECDSWAIVDTLCFRLFDRTQQRWVVIDRWAADETLFVKRAAFALLWALALHDPQAEDAKFRGALDLIRDTAGDGRHLVVKAQTMAMRAILRKRPALATDVLDLADELAASSSNAARKIGRPILNEERSRRTKGASADAKT